MNANQSSSDAMVDTTAQEEERVATFALGCFWGAEEEFAKVVVGRGGRTRVGYMGGRDEPKPPVRNGGRTRPLELKDVKTGKLGHKEVVQVRDRVVCKIKNGHPRHRLRAQRFALIGRGPRDVTVRRRRTWRDRHTFHS